MCDDKNKEMLERLRKSVKHSRWLAGCNHCAVFILTFFGAICSATAAIMVSAGMENNMKLYIGAMAAIPAGTMLILSSLNLEDRSRWHWAKTKELEKLEKAISFENKPVEDISKEWSKIEIQFDKTRVQFGPVKG